MIYDTMLLIQLTGLSGAGKTSIAHKVKMEMEQKGILLEIVDGDCYRRTLCKDLSFSKPDRCENIRRLGAVAYSFVQQNRITILAAINPYEEIRQELTQKYGTKTVWIHCPLQVLLHRDTKGLYRKALLPDKHPDKLFNLTGVNDTYEAPTAPDLIINTAEESLSEAAHKLIQFIISCL